jgi:hypothetical protein
MSEETPKMSLIAKLCEAGAAVGWIEKSGRNEYHKYNYATEASIVSKLRGELFKRKVFIFPHIIRNERVEIDVVTEKWNDIEKRKVPSIRKTALSNVDIEWTFVDGDSGEKYTVMVPGVGEDSVDKGLYKAFTGSEKYMLMKCFLLPTGDDPEKDSKEDAEDAVYSAREAAAAVAEKKIADLKAKDQKGKKSAVGTPDYVPGLFYTVLPSGMYEITGDKAVMTLQKDLLGRFWSGVAKAVVVTGEQLEDLKWSLEQRNCLFSKLEAPQ